MRYKVTMPPCLLRSTSVFSVDISILHSLQSGPASSFQVLRLDEIWAEAYGEVEGVEWISAGAWDPLHIFTREPIRSLADMKGKRVFGVPTAGRFLSRYGLVPVTLPWDDIEVAIGTGELEELPGAVSRKRTKWVGRMSAVMHCSTTLPVLGVDRILPIQKAGMH